MLNDSLDVPDGHCEEDWVELQGLLCHCEIHLRVQHVPGHARWTNHDMDVENWAARWNDRADREANMAMKLHGQALLRLHQRLWAHHEGELADVCALQELHLDIVEKPKAARKEDEQDDEGGKVSLTGGSREGAPTVNLHFETFPGLKTNVGPHSLRFLVNLSCRTSSRWS